MASKILLLWLEGPLQSWSASPAMYRRPTESFPTKSALWGLIFNALGWYGKQKPALQKVHDLPVRILGFQDRYRPECRDFQTIGVAWDENDPWQSVMRPKTLGGQRPAGGPAARIVVKTYLTDARFAAFVRIPEAWTGEIDRAMRNPVGTVYLGRKACVPSAPVYLGIFNSEMDAMNGMDAYLKERYETEAAEKPVFEVSEVDRYNPEAEVIVDNPTAFGERTECEPRCIVCRTLG